MEKKIVSGIMLTLLLMGMLILAFKIQPAKAIGTVYIRPDGSVDPPTAPIQRDGDRYTFIDNIYDSIVVERNNIIVDGAGYTVQGTGSGVGIDIHYRNNVTIKNARITVFITGILLFQSSDNMLSGNDIANNLVGIYLGYSSGNTLSGNNITHNQHNGIYLEFSSDYNALSGNNIASNKRGVNLVRSSSNLVYNNNFFDNTEQTKIWESYNNVWDDGYPSGGNYWSDYEERYPEAKELDGSGIWDAPYEIDAANKDNYPLMEPWSPLPRTIGELKTEIEELGSEGEIDNQGIVKSLITKLDVVQKLIDKGKIDEAKSILEDDFIAQVQNLTDIHITPEAAETLIESAEYIINHL